MNRRTLLTILALTAAVAALAPSAAAEEKQTLGLRYPSLTPDGKIVAFAYRGDIWTAAVDGSGTARRLTIHEAQDTLPRVSPDGKRIAFSSLREGSYDVYVVPIEGGRPERVTFHSGVEVVSEWSPDGKRILYASNRDTDSHGLDLYEIPADGGPSKRLTRDGGIREGAYSADGKRLVYVRGFSSIYWDNYEGSGNYDIWTSDLTPADALPSRLTETRANERYPFFSADGKSVYFVTEEKGVANFYAMPASGEGDRRQVTSFEGLDVHRPDISPDRERVVFERGGKLFWTDLTAEKPAAHAIPLLVESDVRHSGVARRTITNGTQHVDVSSDGRTVVFSVHGDLWEMNANGGGARRLTSGAPRDEWPRISPDGRWIAFQSDRTDNSDLFLFDRRSKSVRQVTKHKAGDFFHCWAPDGRRLAFCSERSGNRDIWTVDVESGELTQVTRDPAPDDDPDWSRDGRLIAFDSGRQGSQAIYVMDADGSNVRRVTSGSGFFQVPSFSPDGRMIAYESFNPASGQSGGIYVVATAGGQSMQVSHEGSAVSWSPKDDWLYFTAGQDGRQEIYRMPAPKAVENRQKVPFHGSVEVDLRGELADLFEEAWKRLRDGFYDPKMHGVDWDAMKKRYGDMAVDAESREEFQNVVRQMLAELGASHLGIYGGAKPSNTVSAEATPTGYLGADLSDEATEGGGRKVTSVLRGGPADGAGLRVGDEIVQIGKTKLVKDTDLDQVFSGTVGKEVGVRYRPITEKGMGDARSTKIKPVPQGQIDSLRYKHWVSNAARKVRKESKGRAGYIHLNAMNGQNLERFRRAVDKWNKDGRVKGIVLDVRNNGGGNIHQQLIQILAAEPYAMVRPRGAPQKIPQPAYDRHWGKPVVVLINERSFSDAEVFPYAFKQVGLGKVVGVPTAGGVIGTNDITLSDGTVFRIPRVGYYGLDGTNLEGLGVEPDIRVEVTPEDRRKGRDPQLDKGIEVLLAEIEAVASEAAADEEAEPDADEETEPDTPQPTDDVPLSGGVNPLGDVRVGEWTRYRFAMPGASQLAVRIEVTEVTSEVVRVSSEIVEGPPMTLPLPEELPRTGTLLQALEAHGKVLWHETRQIEIGGEMADALVADVEWSGQRLRMTYTNAVPAWGLYRVEMGKAVLMEAVEWGVGDADGSPASEPDEAPEEEPAEPSSDDGDASAPPSEGDAEAVETEGAVERAETPVVADPLADAQVGEWIRLRTRVQGQPVESTLRVVEVGADVVKIRATVPQGEGEVQGPVHARPRREHLRLGRSPRVAVTVGDETVEVAGRTIRCTVVTRTHRSGVVDKRWLSNEIPVTGLVRRVRDGETVAELLAWGSEADSSPASVAR